LGLEYKFRGKACTDGRWVYGDVHFNQKRTVCHIHQNGERISSVDVIPNSVGLFLFTTDKNGKEEYEGDIVKTDTGLIGIVTLEKQNLHRHITWEFTPMECHKKGILPYRNYAIIGNATDNKDLLKGACIE
jgi:hypothetical protein